MKIHLETRTPQRIRIVAKDAGKPNTFYVNRSGMVRGKRVFELPMPISPKNLTISVFNQRYGDVNGDRSFRVQKFDVAPLQTWDINTTKDTEEFVKFARQFSENAGVLSTGLYESAWGKYKIKYFDVIRNRKTGAPIPTPARIGNTTGIIEISKKDFIKYTVPMRMIILLHEFSHVYINDDIADETQADLNGLYVYLGKGFPRVEAHKAFLNVFDKADTYENERRYHKIRGYISAFDKGRIVKPNKT